MAALSLFKADAVPLVFSEGEGVLCTLRLLVSEGFVSSAEVGGTSRMNGTKRTETLLFYSVLP